MEQLKIAGRNMKEPLNCSITLIFQTGQAKLLENAD